LSKFFLVAGIVVVIACVALFLRKPREKRRERGADSMDTLAAWPPRATRVLSTVERQTYELLSHALPGHMILAQVPLQRFIKVPTRNSYAEWLRRVGQINADFVVCDADSQVLAVIEVEAEDDQPGSRAQRRRERMVRVLKSAQVPCFVWRAGALPSVGQAREALLPRAAVPELSDAVPDAPGPMREPPPSTWFDDFDSAPAPLAGAGPAAVAAAPMDVNPRPQN
jgi:hypothetical protein